MRRNNAWSGHAAAKATRTRVAVSVMRAAILRRRVRRVVILFSDSETPTPPGVNRLGMEVVPAEEAAGAVLAALKGEREG